MVRRPIATWWIDGLGAAAVGITNAIAVTVVSGATAGFGGACTSAYYSGATPRAALRAGYRGAITGAAGALVGSAVFGANPRITSFRDAAGQFAIDGIRWQADKLARRNLGISGWEFNGYLLAASFLGNSMFGDRTRDLTGGDRVNPRPDPGPTPSLTAAFTYYRLADQSLPLSPSDAGP
jgi:hypothetical protein